MQAARSPKPLDMFPWGHRDSYREHRPSKRRLRVRRGKPRLTTKSRKV